MGKIAKDKNRPIIIKLNNAASKHRLLKLSNLKFMSIGTETNFYINLCRTILELVSPRILRKAVADLNNLNVKHIIRKKINLGVI